MGSFLFKNDGTGKFQEVGAASGVAYDGDGIPHGNMGVDCGDYDHDGLLDFFVTSYHRELPALYRNLGDGMFDDVTRSTGAGQAAFPHVKWGCGLVDFDNDGFKDIFIGCGHLLDKAELIDDTTSYEVAPILLRNNGHGQFVNISDFCGEGMKVKMVARGVAFDDLDNDGDIDVVVLNSRRRPTLLRNMLNELGSKNHWLQIDLRGVKTNRDGVGRGCGPWPANWSRSTKSTAAGAIKATSARACTSAWANTTGWTASRSIGSAGAWMSSGTWPPTGESRLWKAPGAHTTRWNSERCVQIIDPLSSTTPDFAITRVVGWYKRSEP